MKDAFGNKLKVGDKVVFVYGKNRSACLETGKITKIYINPHNCPGEKEECSVDNHAHILSFRVAKIDNLASKIDIKTF